MVAAVIGEIEPTLLLPSVNKITILLLAFEAFNLPTALANPIPIAVPSCINPFTTRSALTLLSKLIKVA